MNTILQNQINTYLGKHFVFSANMQDLFQVISETYERAEKEKLSIEQSRELVLADSLKNNESLKQSVLELSKTKIGMMNLLEDLDIEKQGIEQIVHERTKQLSDEKDRIETLVEGMGEGVVAVDRFGKIVLWNKTAISLTGWKAEEATGKPFHDILKIVSEKDRADKSDFVDLAMKTKIGKYLENEVLLIKKDATELPVGASAAPLINSEDECFGAIIVLRDVTFERKIEKAKDQFVSLASHQLRTPLSIIRAYSEMLIDGDGGPLTGLQKEFVDEIHRANIRMIDLVNSFLSVSRIDLGTFRIEPTPSSLANIMDEELKDLELLIRQKKLKVTKTFSKDLPLINVDPKLTGIVLQNILSNAVKYTPNGGSVSLEIKKQPSGILIKISDTGIGIPKEQQSKVFTKLFRADNALMTDNTGTGLGLYIAKAILDESGSKIQFASEENKGTTFVVTLPIEGMKKREGVRGLE